MNKVKVFVFLNKYTQLYGILNEVYIESFVKKEIGIYFNIYDSKYKYISNWFKKKDIQNIFNYFNIKTINMNKLDMVNYLLSFLGNINNLYNLAVEAGIYNHIKNINIISNNFKKVRDAGYIYCIKNNNKYKIGKSNYIDLNIFKENLYKRYHTPYGFQLTDNNFKYKYYEDNLSKIEKDIHTYYTSKRLDNSEIFYINKKISNIKI